MRTHPRAQRTYLSKPQTLFPAQAQGGRQILFGFSYLQSIGKGASTSVWFPASWEEQIGARLLLGDRTVLDDLCVQWAAVRQFDLLQEGSNYRIYPMDVTNPQRAAQYLGQMRAGGLRITVISLGRYTHSPDQDDLQILDMRLQKALADFISMIYLDELSLRATTASTLLTRSGAWRFDQALPHVAQTLGATALFKPLRAQKDQRRFFDLLALLPTRQIQHEVAVGLQIPEHATRHQWIYFAAGDMKFHAFQTAMTDIFRAFDGLSLHELNGHTGPASDRTLSTMRHMRGYGDHTTTPGRTFLQSCASSASAALALSAA